MKKTLSPSRLRANLCRILERVLESGEPVKIERKGRRLQITTEPPGRLPALRPHPGYLKGEPDDIVHMDWSVDQHLKSRPFSPGGRTG